MAQSVRTAQQIGAILRRVRRDAGLTQTELGDKTGLRQATISKLEAGASATRVSTLLDALAALGLEIRIVERGKGSPAEFEDLF